MVPLEDQETEIASLLSGDVDFIYPQFTDTLGVRWRGTRTSSPASWLGTDYEGFYFQQPRARSPTRSSARRSPCRSTATPCSSRSTADLRRRPAFNRGRGCRVRPERPGPYCFDSFADNAYDPQGAEQLLDRRRVGEGRRGLLGEGRRRRRRSAG